MSAESFGVSLALDGYTQATYDFADFCGLAHKIVEAWLVEIAGIKGNVELGAYFGAGCLGDNEKLVEFGSGASFEAFGYI